ncbi:MAG: CAAD domain-containing protein [Jaaginema sp. PMC 1079.18]|nr:CAAD domain-containing protein [Jaaginema sp. PMC 1080.18]MEC4851359.1 CAAD domain-containing protein [Jaaginema sp. PMC 1079.18]MEC4865371.1 CAAD domain-containing protein [Jaaginema sp. PMC 1078.18]
MQEPPTTTTEQQETGINTENAGSLSTVSVSSEQWQEWVTPVTEFLSELPNYIVQFFSDYKQPLISLGLIVAGIITVKVTLALLDAINDIPLLAPILELVGLGYVGWFVFRYMLKASDRKELVAEFDKLKGQVIGSDS